MENSQICRLCLRKFDNFVEITNYINKKIRFILNQHKINICYCCKWYICDVCLQQLDFSCNFKQTLVETEEKILNVDRYKRIPRNLKTLVGFDDIQGDIEICRLCLRACYEHSIYLFHSELNTMPFSFVEKMCHDVFEMDLKLSDEPIMCYQCWEFLQKTHTFIKRLLKSECAINNFMKENDIKIINCEDLKKIGLPDETDSSDDDDDDDDNLNEEDGNNGREEHEGMEIKIEDQDTGDSDGDTGLNDCEKSVDCTKKDLEENSKNEIISKNFFVNRRSPNYSCKYCDFKTNIESDVWSHISEHNKVEMHMKSHSDVKFLKWRCPLCETTFEKKVEWNLHFKAVHTEYSRRGITALCEYQCPNCEFVTNRSSSLRKHSKTHEQKAVSQCKFCHKKFSMESKLRKHVELQHSNLKSAT